MKNVYWLAKEEIATLTCKYVSLNNLVKFLGLLGKLSTTFQSEKNFSIIPLMVESTINAMKDSPGSKLREFYSILQSDTKYKDLGIRDNDSERARFSSSSKQFIQAVTDNLHVRSRFPALPLQEPSGIY